MLKEIKQAIIAQLQPLSDRARIFADDTEGEAGSNSQVRHDYIIRVSYAGGTFTPPTTTTRVAFQQGDRSFQIAVEYRDLRNEDKAVELLEEIQGLIFGFCPCVQGVTGEFYLGSDRFIRNDNGVYFYAVTFNISTHIKR
ncbi:Gp37 family protein [Aulosira sp. FACHB-615]|uniref:Gp37 family protein n=1 Tax=Aulosira sp. FACHB-615 TaxID=2692777 RepID=UPI0016880710|nr:Gp37 family protein [Aulosira sp. FACHB-615]MBD2492476.1 hypothetical protein [Aulosira sp. FACHB-615]